MSKTGKLWSSGKNMREISETDFCFPDGLKGSDVFMGAIAGSLMRIADCFQSISESMEFLDPAKRQALKKEHAEQTAHERVTDWALANKFPGTPLLLHKVAYQFVERHGVDSDPGNHAAWEQVSLRSVRGVGAVRERQIGEWIARVFSKPGASA